MLPKARTALGCYLFPGCQGKRPNSFLKRWKMEKAQCVEEKENGPGVHKAVPKGSAKNKGKWESIIHLDKNKIQERPNSSEASHGKE